MPNVSRAKLLHLTSRQTHRWWWGATMSVKTLRSPRSASQTGAVSYPCSEKEKKENRMWKSVVDHVSKLYDAIKIHQLINSVDINGMLNRNAVAKKLKTITGNKVGVKLWQGLADPWCVQTLTGAVSWRIQKQWNPQLARFVESSPPNWVIHGSNALDYIFFTITSVSLMLFSGPKFSDIE